MGFRGIVSSKYVMKLSSSFLFHALRALEHLVPFKTKGGSIVPKKISVTFALTVAKHILRMILWSKWPIWSCFCAIVT